MDKFRNDGKVGRLKPQIVVQSEMCNISNAKAFYALRLQRVKNLVRKKKKF